jgi:hypothetical protein
MFHAPRRQRVSRLRFFPERWERDFVGDDEVLPYTWRRSAREPAELRVKERGELN